MNWIKCSERMPEEGVHVLISTEAEIMYIAYYLKSRGCWECAFFDESFVDITHWMPLPEPPKE
jgi:hypothetical protein